MTQRLCFTRGWFCTEQLEIKTRESMIVNDTAHGCGSERKLPLSRRRLRLCGQHHVCYSPLQICPSCSNRLTSTLQWPSKIHSRWIQATQTPVVMMQAGVQQGGYPPAGMMYPGDISAQHRSRDFHSWSALVLRWWGIARLATAKIYPIACYEQS